MDNLSKELLEADSKIPQIERKIKGLVAYADTGLVVINIGSKDGVESGMELSVQRVKASINDPATGKLLREITEPVGTIRVTKVDESSAEATIVSGSDFKVKDVVSN